MTFQEAVRTVLQQKYATFSGRARRSEFWFFALFSAIVRTIANIIDAILHTGNSTTGLVSVVVSLALLVPSLAVGARRLHDTGRSGWWLLIALIPLVGIIILIVFWVQDSHGDNQYGPNPKGLGSGEQGYGQAYGQGYGGGYGPPPDQGYGTPSPTPPGYGTPAPTAPDYGTPSYGNPPSSGQGYPPPPPQPGQDEPPTAPYRP